MSQGTEMLKYERAAANGRDKKHHVYSCMVVVSFVVRDRFLKKNSGNAEFDRRMCQDRGVGPSSLTLHPHWGKGSGEGLCPLQLSQKKSILDLK